MGMGHFIRPNVVLLLPQIPSRHDLLQTAFPRSMNSFFLKVLIMIDHPNRKLFQAAIFCHFFPGGTILGWLNITGSVSLFWRFSCPLVSQIAAEFSQKD
jgi:hypothetical protein